MKKLSLIAIRVLALVMVAFTAAFMLDAFLGAGLFTGIALAMSGAAAAEVINPDTVTTKNLSEKSSELLVDTVSKKITQMRPSLYPIDTILREVGRTVTAPSWRYGFYDVDSRSIRDTVSELAPVTIDALGGGVLENKSFEVKVTNMHVWQVDDNCLFVNCEGNDDKPLVGNIVKKDNGNSKLNVMFVNRKPGAFDIPQDCKLVRIGNSKSEMDAQTSPYSVIPQKNFNYSQIHMAQVEEGVYAKLHDKEVQWGLADYQAQALYDMRRSMELTSLIGARGVLMDPEDEQQKYFSGGLMRFIDNYIDVPAAGITNNWFVDATEKIFSDNSGADTRFLFAGNKLISDLSKVPDIKKQIDAKNVEVKFGVTFSKVETIYGVVLIKHHKLLTELGEYATGLVLDMNNIERAVFKAMGGRKLMLKESGQRNADAHVIDEAFCLALLYPDTHAIIRPEAVIEGGS